MPELFVRTLYVGWGDLDSNGHMKNTAYLDKAVDVRMMYFQEHGFALGTFEQRHFGPAVKRDEIEYYRELRLLEPVRVTLLLAGASEDGSRFRLRNEFFRETGPLVARLTSTGGWLDLVARKLIVPPDGLVQALRGLVRSDDFEPLASSIK